MTSVFSRSRSSAIGDPAPNARRGRLILIVGASGCGKDTLLAGARHVLAADPQLIFAHRYITRPADAGGENHVALALDEFAQRRHARLFALDWASHGLYYALGSEIDLWVASGKHVVANGSRGHLPEARLRYPDLVALEILVSPEILRARLLSRGRESATKVEQRLEHSQQLASTHADFHLSNDGTPEEGINRIVARLRTLAATTNPPCD